MTTELDRGAIRIDMAGTGALLLDCADGPFSQDRQRLVWAVAEAAKEVPGVRECVPGMNNLLVVFDTLLSAPDEIEAALHRLWRTTVPIGTPGQEWVIPVRYGGAGGEDLPWMAEAVGLTPEAFVALHAGATYSVAAVGAMAGFPYLSGLDPRLAQPRRATPRLKLAEGAVIIGGSQAGMMPCSAPSGWHVIGAASFRLFDATVEPPARLRPGDTVRFAVESVEA
jgi:KipI family sensor histidine kinase inhibitor